MGLDEQLLGHAPALQRRFWKDVDQPPGSSHSLSFGHRRFTEKYLADNTRTGGGTGRSLLRSGTCSTVRIAGRRRLMVANARVVGSSASASLDSGTGRAGAG